MADDPTRPTVPDLRPTGERIDPTRELSPAERVLADRHLFAYEHAANYAQKQADNQRAHVIDVGCGLGYGSAILANHGFRVIGVDTDRAAIDEASERHGTDNCVFVVMQDSMIPAQPGSADFVIAFQVIEHVPDASRFAADISRVLKPGGHALMTTPNRELRLDPLQRPWNRHHVTEFSAETLSSVLTPHFSDTRIEGIDADEVSRHIELARVKTLRSLARWDPLRLRTLLPQELIDRVVRRQMASSPAPSHAPTFTVVAGDEAPLDLLALCTK